MTFQIISIAILLIFYGCYFLKMISQHQKGIHTDQMGKGKKGAAKSIEIIMKIVTYIVPLAETMSILQNTTSLPTPVRILGSCTGIAGVTVFIISVLTMKDNWRAGVSKTDHTDLVTNGVYRLSRNPAFLGFDLVYIGILLMFFHWALLIVSLFAMLMFHLQIVYVEEAFLLQAFEEEYLQYQKKVRRYIGRSMP